MIKYLYISCLLFSCLRLPAQAPPGYYEEAEGLHGESLQQALHQIIDNHQSRSYDQLWDDFFDTDNKSNKVWDIYSDNPQGTPPYQYQFFTDQCGNYNKEGDCYNREHCWPKSWFGGEVMPMYTDLFHVIPTDGFVNGMRGALPYGETNQADWTSENGSKKGSSSISGYSGVVFEPIDQYKGDLARTFFYFSTRYLGEDQNWPGSDMVDGAQLKSWALNMLIDWHLEDPVSQKEIDRNEAVFDLQNNRNPFIDDPDFVYRIWIDPSGASEQKSIEFDIFPNPANQYIRIIIPRPFMNQSHEIKIIDLLGEEVVGSQSHGNQQNYELSTANLDDGMYIVWMGGVSKLLVVHH